MAPKLVVVYFNIAGAAEPIRWALAQSGLEWEDKRLSREEFGELKPTLPNGQVPVLEVDGYPLPQSMAILRYVGKLGGLYPTDDLEAAKCDAVMACTVDLSMNMRPSFREQDEAKKLEMRVELAANFIPIWLGNMEKQLGKTHGLYFFEKMTVADLAIANCVRTLKVGVYDGIPPSIIDAHPKLVALTESILAEPKIAEFIAKTGTSK